MKLSIDELSHLSVLLRRAVLSDEANLMLHPHLIICEHCRAEVEKKIELSKALAVRVEQEWIEVVTGPLPA